MQWTTNDPKYGDIIRVKVKFYYHYGLFEDAEHVIQFGLPDNTGLDPDSIAVITTDMQTFLHGGMLETAKLSFAEKRKRRSPEKTIRYAHEQLGRTGYNILHNNCEHFVNECVFGVAESTLVDSTREEIRKRI